jgi:hypothetical protein
MVKRTQPDGKKQNRPKIPPKIAPGSEERGWINERGQEEIENDIGIQTHRWQTRDKPEGEPGEDKDDGVRQGEFARDDDKQRDACEKPDDDLSLMHDKSVRCWFRAGAPRLQACRSALAFLHDRR